MEIRELRAFIAVVEDRALSAAARRLHLSQSALTQTIQGLERQLGVQLLVRNHAGTTPTAAGAILAAEARVLVDRHDQAVRAVTGAAAEPEMRLRVGVPLELPADLLPAALAQMIKWYPQTKVEVVHSSSVAQIAGLRADELDVALVRDRPADPSLDAVLAVEEDLGVILTVGSVGEVAEGGGVRLQHLAGLRWAGFPRSDSPAYHDQVTAMLRGHGIVVDKPATNDDHPFIAEVKLAAVAAGNAFALASPTWSRPLPDGLAWYPLVGNPIVRRTWAVWTASSSRRDLGAFVNTLDLTSH